MDALPKSGIVPKALADMFPMLEEGVIALQSNVLVGPFTAFHFVCAALVVFLGFTVLLIRSGPPKQQTPAPAPPPPAPSSADAAAPPPSSDASSSAPAAAADADAVTDPTQTSGVSRRAAAGGAAAAAAAAAEVPAADVKAPKKTNSKTKKDA